MKKIFKTVLIVTPCLCAPLTTVAESKFFVHPSVAASAISDSNVDYSAVNSSSDQFLRLSPALDFGYADSSLSVLMHHDQDAEYYDERSDLNSSSARRNSGFRVEKQLTRRFGFSVEGLHEKTETPGDLNRTTAFQTPRGEASRTQFGAGFDFTTRPRERLGVNYQDAHETLSGASPVDIQSLRATYSWQLTGLHSITLGYLGDRYDFAGGQSESSDLASVRWEYQPNRSTRFNVMLGPRITEGAVTAAFSARGNHRFDQGFVSFDCGRDESTLIGEASTATIGYLGVGVGYVVQGELVLGLSSRITSIENATINSDVATTAVQAFYPIRPYLGLAASIQHEAQDSAGAFDITRNAIAVTLILEWPESIPNEVSLAKKPYFIDGVLEARRLMTEATEVTQR